MLLFSAIFEARKSRRIAGMFLMTPFKMPRLVEPEDDEAEHNNEEEDGRAVIDLAVENEVADDECQAEEDFKNMVFLDELLEVELLLLRAFSK